MLITLPFPGFYNSLLDSELVHVFDMEASHYAEAKNLSHADVSEALEQCVRWSIAHDHIARRWVVGYEQWLLDHFEIDVMLHFQQMTSPREYNFTTDHVVAKISEDDARCLYNAVDKKQLDNTCRSHLTSCSGFISFYDPDYQTWGEVEDWDQNQLSMILHALDPDDEHDEDIFEWLQMQGDFHQAVAMAMNETALDAKLELLEMKAELEAEESDGREYPRDIALSTPKYVSKFCQMNHLKD